MGTCAPAARSDEDRALEGPAAGDRAGVEGVASEGASRSGGWDRALADPSASASCLRLSSASLRCFLASARPSSISAIKLSRCPPRSMGRGSDDRACSISSHARPYALLLGERRRMSRERLRVRPFGFKPRE